MLEELGISDSTLFAYLSSPSVRLAVLVPGAASLAIIGFYFRSGGISERLQLVWLLALPVSFYCARWDDSGDVQRLYVFSAFSVACALLLFGREYIAPALAYALTFVSLWGVDMTHAFCQSLERGGSLRHFYLGVGGAGALDALFLMPLMTAAVVAYAGARMRSNGEVLRSV